MSDFNQFLKTAESANVIPVIETMPADLLTPLSVYLKLAANEKYSFLLESVEGGESLARYSFVGVAPKSIISGSDYSVTISDEFGDHEQGISMFDYLRDHFAVNRVLEDGELPSFIGGAIGYLGYSCAGWFEPTLKRPEVQRDHGSDASFMFFRSVVAFDHAKQVIKIISLVFTDESCNDIEKLHLVYENALASNLKIKNILENGQISLPRSNASPETGEVSSNWEKAEFESAVIAIKEMIAETGEARPQRDEGGVPPRQLPT